MRSFVRYALAVHIRVAPDSVPCTLALQWPLPLQLLLEEPLALLCPTI